MNLVIVESPAKSKTIEKILGKEYKVVSSFGHIRDLAKDGYKNTGVDIEHDYKPHYTIPDSKKKVVADLKKLVSKYNKIILATDEDREGEAISWHLKDELKLSDKKIDRITFTEITESALLEALKHPRKVDNNLVLAQQARRILDRLVGFELSGLLWKKVRGKLSAGRVQSVAVKLVVEREREITKFKPEEHYNITGEFRSGKNTLSAQINEDIPTLEKAKELLKKCLNAEFKVNSIDKSPSTRKPSPPFTTSTLQQTASQRYGFSVKRTMIAAQKLYEHGHITYMRTDSMVISNSALASIASFVEASFGKPYVLVRKYKSKSKLAQEAHEAIRPTYINKEKVSQVTDEQKIYELIRLRTLASQMTDAKVEKTEVKISISNVKNNWFVCKGEIVLFDGFMKVYKGTPRAIEDVIIPDLKVGNTVSRKSIRALQRYSKPPSRYTEATLVKKLEELGIGRPSTYAPTIDKITSNTRGYVSKETRDGTPVDYVSLSLIGDNIKEEKITENTGAQKNRLFANDIGIVVTDYLDTQFADIMNYSFTAEVEDRLDDIAGGKEKWDVVIDTYYKPFTKVVGKALKSSERSTGERILGKDPKTGHTILARLSKYGPVIQLGTPDEVGEQKPTYVGLMSGQSLETITLNDALKLLELPRVIGTYKNHDMEVNKGRYGPYIKYNDMYVSIPRDYDIFSIGSEDAKKLIEEKLTQLKPIGSYHKLPITKGVGRFGPYIKWNNEYISISRRSGFELASITEKQAHELIEEKIKKDALKLIKEWKDEGIKLMKGRWGPYAKKEGSGKIYRLPRTPEGTLLSPEQAEKMTLDDVKKIIS